MKYYVVLDTNILREMGDAFNSHADYIELGRFLHNTHGEMLLSEIVIEEIYHQFKLMVEKKKKEYDSSVDSFLRIPGQTLNKLSFLNVKVTIESLLKEYQERLKLHPFTKKSLNSISASNFSGKKLTQFINSEKAQNKKEPQVKDLLILNSILNYINKDKRKKTTSYTLISKDKGFTNNENFKILNDLYPNIKLEVAESISEYLKERGHNLDYVNAEFFGRSFTENRLFSEIDDFQQNILENTTVLSQFYKYKILSKDIGNFELVGFYSYKDKDKFRFVLDIRAAAKITFAHRKSSSGFSGLGSGFGNPISNGWGFKNKKAFGIFSALSFAIFDGTINVKYTGLLDNVKKKIKSSSISSFQPIMSIPQEFIDGENSTVISAENDDSI